jgi:hypothetical protein
MPSNTPSLRRLAIPSEHAHSDNGDGAIAVGTGLHRPKKPSTIYEESAWFYSVPLTSVNTEADVERLLVQPLVTLAEKWPLEQRGRGTCIQEHSRSIVRSNLEPIQEVVESDQSVVILRLDRIMVISHQSSHEGAAWH